MAVWRKLQKEQGAAVLLAAVVLICSGLCVGAVDDPEGLPISSIETAGNVTYTRAKILSTVRLRAGELFSDSIASADIERIGQLEGVRGVRYRAEVVDGKVKLTYVVEEKNLARSLSFKGNNKLKDGQLSDELGFKRGDYIDAFLLGTGAESIKDLYMKRGYPFAKVEADKDSLSTGKVIYDIYEGPRTKVKSVTFKGNSGLSKKELRKAIKIKTENLFLWPYYFKQKQLDEDVEKLRKAYQKKGYLDSTVDAATSFSEDGGEVDVTFIIAEGSVYIVDDIKLMGGGFFDKAVLVEELKLQTGDYYSEERAEFDAKRIRSKFTEIGFVDAKVDHKRLFNKPGSVNVEFNVSQGERFRIGQIVITGNETIKDRSVRRILDEENFKPGQWYNADIARGDETGDLEIILKRTVMTESAVIKPMEATSKGVRDAQVSLVEGQTGSIMFGAGVGSDSGVVGQIILDQRNFDISDVPESWSELLLGKAFRGAGQRLRAMFSPGLIESTFSVSFTEPYLYDMPVGMTVGTSGYYRGREAYDEERLAGHFGLEKRYQDDWRRGISFRVENVTVKSLEFDAPQEIIDVKGDNLLIGSRLYIKKDTTDNRYLPTAGYIFDAGYEQVSGDYTFGILSAGQRWYRTLYEDLAERKTVLETKVQAATTVQDAPPFEKFYAGGTGVYSIRGFDYRGVSTRGLQTNIVNPEYKDPIGSDWIVIGNAEIVQPLGNEVLSALFFVDSGLIDTGGIRASVGTGIQVLIPQWFGPVPMRFELAFPFMKDDEDETRAFSFSVGALF